MTTLADQRQDLMLGRVLVVLLIAIAIMRLVLTFFHEANWDEYLNLSMVYDHQRGELHEILQTGFVHLFRWVPLVSDNEADQIIAARLFYLGIGLITSLAIWKITRALTSKNAAYFAVLCYWSLSYTLIHGAAFRTDPMGACTMMCVLWLIICRPLTVRVALTAGVLAGLAGIFTIKAVFYVPALILVAMLRGPTLSKGVALVILAGCSAGISFAGLTALHAATFPDIASPFAFLDRTTGSTMNTQDFAILIVYLDNVLVKDISFFAVLGIGFIGLVVRLLGKARRLDGLVAMALLTPLLSVLVYRDVYPYFYPFIFAPVMLLAGFAWQDVSKRFDARLLLLIAGGLCLNAAIVTVKKLEHPIATQRIALDVIHSTFPGDTTYIDGRSMVSSMNKRGLFMSRWGMTDYRRAGQPIMEDIIRTQQPQFLLANTWHLQLDKLSPERSEDEPLGLLAADFRLLQDNYIPYWGPIYAPGKVIQAGEGAMRILLPGTYRLSSGMSVSIDGKEVLLGDSVYLEARNYSVISSDISTLMLDIPLPQNAPPERSLFGGF